MYTCRGIYDCAVDWVSLDPELLLESKIDITWYTPQSLHNSSCCELAFVISEAGVGAIAVVDEDAIGVDEVDPIAAVDEDTIGVDDVSTPTRLAGARVEGRKIPYLLT